MAQVIITMEEYNEFQRLKDLKLLVHRSIRADKKTFEDIKCLKVSKESVINIYNELNSYYAHKDIDVELTN